MLRCLKIIVYFCKNNLLEIHLTGPLQITSLLLPIGHAL
uniref:Uncharacterized protein n=1 Tax=Rhizophora mucronata TaxID=61149 RepID=A0A2P2N791_RHIMU